MCCTFAPYLVFTEENSGHRSKRLSQKAFLEEDNLLVFILLIDIIEFSQIVVCLPKDERWALWCSTPMQLPKK